MNVNTSPELKSPNTGLFKKKIFCKDAFHKIDTSKKDDYKVYIRDSIQSEFPGKPLNEKFIEKHLSKIVFLTKPFENLKNIIHYRIIDLDESQSQICRTNLNSYFNWKLKKWTAEYHRELIRKEKLRLETNETINCKICGVKIPETNFISHSMKCKILVENKDKIQKNIEFLSNNSLPWLNDALRTYMTKNVMSKNRLNKLRKNLNKLKNSNPSDEEDNNLKDSVSRIYESNDENNSQDFQNIKSNNGIKIEGMNDPNINFLRLEKIDFSEKSGNEAPSHIKNSSFDLMNKPHKFMIDSDYTSESDEKKSDSNINVETIHKRIYVLRKKNMKDSSTPKEDNCKYSHFGNKSQKELSNNNEENIDIDLRTKRKSSSWVAKISELDFEKNDDNTKLNKEKDETNNNIDLITNSTYLKESTNKYVQEDINSFTNIITNCEQNEKRKSNPELDTHSKFQLNLFGKSFGNFVNNEPESSKEEVALKMEIIIKEEAKKAKFNRYCYNIIDIVFKLLNVYTTISVNAPSSSYLKLEKLYADSILKIKIEKEKLGNLMNTKMKEDFKRIDDEILNLLTYQNKLYIEIINLEKEISNLMIVSTKLALVPEHIGSADIKQRYKAFSTHSHFFNKSFNNKINDDYHEEINKKPISKFGNFIHKLSSTASARLSNEKIFTFEEDKFNDKNVEEEKNFDSRKSAERTKTKKKTDFRESLPPTIDYVKRKSK